MNCLKKTPLQFGIFFLLLFALVNIATAQPDATGLFEEVTDTPINTGLILMTVAGIGYGLKQLNNRKK